ncbi:MAG TPA: circadian clock protein KaiC [Burkholderiales bacterium]|nr:circadian clock protein KaiC [Burkholderiales bacterium]
MTLDKAPTGIEGFDEITYGGLPRGRPTLVCGSAGSGKTLFGVEFLVRGATEFGEPGVFLAFEETPEELTRNVRSLGFDLDALIRSGKLAADYVKVERHEVEESGEYDLEALFLRLGLAIDTVKAKRVVIDTLEALFSALRNEFTVRAELRRLFQWLKERGVSAVITAERGEGTLTRHGLEEYVSDCVILLDNRVVQQAAVRRLRVVKYRGSAHGTNEYPFLIGEGGFSVLPLSSIKLAHSASTERQSSGIRELDSMLEGQGFYKGSTVLVSGTAGTGKSSLAARFAESVCESGKRCIYFAYEEGPRQIMRNMGSIGMKLGTWVERRRLIFHATRPTEQGLEMHLATIHKLVTQHQPSAVIIDPVSNFELIGEDFEIKAMLMRLVDFLKQNQITCLFTSLTTGGDDLESTQMGISSLMDTWLLLRDIEIGGERNRGLYVLKSRGMAHSNQIREFLITSQGIRLVDAYLGPEGVLTGSARLQQEARDRENETTRQQDEQRKLAVLERRRRAVERQIQELRAELAEEERVVKVASGETDLRKKVVADDRAAMGRSRGNGRRQT